MASDKIASHMDKQVSQCSKMQGGTVMGAGPNTVGNPKVGENVKSPFTMQDQNREQGGPPKNKYHDV